mmetsp:Transcript_12584/g.17195  ORF Transcript_12584/g.17195 Transcript_12584/m.17195 type:complete len:101 (-) Transcript_12584:398-700(-)
MNGVSERLRESLSGKSRVMSDLHAILLSVVHSTPTHSITHYTNHNPHSIIPPTYSTQIFDYSIHLYSPNIYTQLTITYGTHAFNSITHNSIHHLLESLTY